MRFMRIFVVLAVAQSLAVGQAAPFGVRLGERLGDPVPALTAESLELFTLTNDFSRFSEPRFQRRSTEVDLSRPLMGVSRTDVEIDQVFIGSCTNGRIEDLRDAAKILKGNKISSNLRMLVIPASRETYMKALDEGLIKIFVEAGALVSAPCCGPCLGGHTGLIGPGAVSLSTSNRNFKGRQGSPEGQVYLSSAKVAAQSAIEGRISIPKGE